MKKKLFAISLIILMMIGLVGCGKSDNPNAGSSQASKYPAKAINLIVPFNTGGGADLAARAFASIAPKYLGQSVIVIQKPGAAGTVAHTSLKNERPDGYTLIITGNSPSTVAPFLEKVQYDPINDFEFAGRFTNLHNVLVVKQDAPWNTIEEFIAYAKANPGKVKVGTSGANSMDDLMVRMLNKSLNIELVPVPFDSTSEAVMAVLGGHITAASGSTSTCLPQVQNGSLKPLAITSDTRDPSYKDVPTLIERGINLSLNNSIGIAAPKGTPKEIIEVLEKAIKQTVEDEGYKAVAAKFGLTVDYLNGSDFKATTQTEGEKVKGIIAK
ncbi:MAG TPA: tripartite tricarboxylate transporter substrate binding protein [Selenomonadales bacterium]|nr:tripartite tricarboxylate transporter substrate binding protein [Selenomonadales bacterium]